MTAQKLGTYISSSQTNSAIRNELISKDNPMQSPLQTQVTNEVFMS